ncbi:MAG: hypothetical protein QXD03_04525 [Candidatus Anstonellales archaeon]
MGEETEQDIQKAKEEINRLGLRVHSAHQTLCTNGDYTDFIPLYKQNNRKLLEVVNNLCNVGSPMVIHAGHL